MKCNLFQKSFFKKLNGEFGESSETKRFRGFIVFWFKLEEEDEERVIRDFTAVKEKIWLLYTPWLSVQIFRMDIPWLFVLMPGKKVYLDLDTKNHDAISLTNCGFLEKRN